MATLADLKAVLNSGSTVAAPGVHDVLSARIVERAGLPAVYCSGNAMGIGLGKGQPYVTLTETAAITRRIAEAIDLPVIVDAGAGFGEPQHIFGAVREIEAAGAAALHIDDQPFPKRAAYHRKQGSVVDIGTMVDRLKVALQARRREDFLIFARTDAYRTTGSIDEVIERARAYAQTGIDGLIALDLGPAEAGKVRSVIGKVPLIWIGGVHPPVPSLTELDRAGFAMALYPFNGIAAVTAALTDLWRTFCAGGVIDQDAKMLSRAGHETLELVGMARYWAIEDGTHAQ